MVGNKHIEEIFSKSQHSIADHPKLVKNLRKVYDQIEDVDYFYQHFIKCFKCLLIHGERETAVNLCLDFAAKFATSFELGKDPEEEEDAECHPFYEKLFDFLLSHHNVKSQAVRFRVCQFINRMLEELSESACISADLFEKIYDAMLERIQDRIASVRVQAVVALQRLQDPTNKECPVIKVTCAQIAFLVFCFKTHIPLYFYRHWFSIWKEILILKYVELYSRHWDAIILRSNLFWLGCVTSKILFAGRLIVSLVKGM
jgi:condensin complex subunit 3